jgi:flagellar biosynthetic protein FliR
VELSHIEQVIQALLSRIDFAWTFLLLSTRFLTFLILVPGLGSGVTGLALRYPAAIALSVATISASQIAPVPVHMFDMAVQFVSEIVLGSIVALVPMLIVSGAQTAGHLATGTMGLNGAQLFDPSTSTSLSDLSRIYSDIAILIFLAIGGHYVAVGQLSGLTSQIQPGSFVLSAPGLLAFIEQSGRIFQIGCLIAAPAVVALLLTNFVLGIISKAVPTVNVFIISFPLTIGVGLSISIIALPEVARLLEREFLRLPELIGRMIQ